MRKAFTIIELIISVTVLIILGSIAIQAGVGLIRAQKMNNAYSRAINMIQRARNLAMTSKKSGVTGYQIKFTYPSGGPFNKVEFIELLSAPPNQIIQEEINLDADDLNAKIFYDTSTECTGDAFIKFESGTAKTLLECSNPSVKPYQFSISINNRAQSRSRIFTIHKAAGIPQISQ